MRGDSPHETPLHAGILPGMAQSRAEATRQRIIDAAVILFAENGYADTGLNDITAAAKVTTGAFYYHFASKESVANAIIREGWPKAVEVLERWLDPTKAGLENIVVMTFALSELLKRDKFVWVSNHLNQAFGQLSESGRVEFKHKADTFVTRIADAIQPSDIRDDVTRHEVGNSVWMIVHGCHLLSDALEDSVFQRLSDSWRLLLRAIAPAESLPYFEQFVTRTAAQYGRAHATTEVSD